MKARIVLLSFGSLLLLGVLLFVGFSYVVLRFDPYRWGVVHSSGFSWPKFAQVKKGEQISAVISRLGEPIRPSEPLTVLTADRNDPCTAGGCRTYRFAGGKWGPTFKEAIVVTNSQGVVIHTEVRQE